MNAWYRGAVAAAAAAGLLLTAACSDDGGDDPLNQNGGDGGAAEWWDIQPPDGDMGTLFQAYVEEYNQANPDGVQMEINSLQNGDPYNGALSTAMSAGDPPDMFQSWGGHELRSYVEAGLVQDLTDSLGDVIETMDPLALEPFTIDGRVYGVPYTSGMVGFWYNTQLFAEAGIEQTPQTWSEFLDAVEALQAADITPIALGNSALWPGHFYWTCLALRLGGLEAFEAAEQNQTLDDPAFAGAGELLQELLDMGAFQDDFLAVNYEGGDGQAATMGNGLAGMELMGQWAAGAQLDHAGITDEAERQQVIETRSFFPFPVIEGGDGTVTEIFGGGDGFAVGADAPEETLDFIRFMFENYDRMVALPGTAPTVVEYQDQVSNPALVPVMENIQTATGIQHYLDRAWPGPVGQAVNENVGALLTGDAEPQAVVDSVNEAWAREQ